MASATRTAVSNDPRQDEVLTLKEAAELIGLSPQTLYLQVRRGAFVAVKSGRDWFVTEAEAKRYEREQAGKMGAASPQRNPCVRAFG